MMRFRLRTLLILLAVVPPVLAWLVWPAIDARYCAWVRQQQLDAISGGGSDLAEITFLAGNDASD